MTYILPQVLVYQEFNVVPAEITDPLRACIVGPRYNLHRYSDADEKPTIKVSASGWTRGQTLTVSWPGRSAGGIVDQTYTKLYMDDAYLEYFQTVGDLVVSGTGKNILTSGTFTFEGTDLSTVFKGRDVTPGDRVRLTDGGGAGGSSSSSSSATTVWTTVTAVSGSVITVKDNLETFDGLVSDIRMELFIVDDVEIAEEGEGALYNWEQNTTQFTVSDYMTAYTDQWPGDDSGPEALPIEQGMAYVHYRELYVIGSSSVGSLSDASLVVDTLGPVDPDNPLAFGVYKALLNANGTAVKYINVETNDLDGYSEAVERLIERNDIYSIVPLTTTKNILDMVAAHVDSMSSAENGRWRIAWFQANADRTIAIDESSDLEATIIDDPEAVGTQYTLVTAANGAFVTDEVRATDVVRINYQTDAFGNVTYDEYVVDAVITETQLRLVSGPDAAIAVAEKIEIWRTRTTNEYATAVAQYAGLWSSRRVYSVWPDTVGNGGDSFAGYYMCCALAGLRSGVVPHQGLTNVETIGFDDVTRSYELFTGAQLNMLAEAGIWIVTKDFAGDGSIYSRHQLSTDNTSLETREQSITTNLDSQSYLFLANVRAYIGIGNVGPTMIRIVDDRLRNTITYLENSNFVDRLGPQLTRGTIRSIEEHPTLRDRILAVLDLELPYPLNNLELRLVI